MNKDLLIKVRDTIQLHKDSFDYDTYLCTNLPRRVDYEDILHDCGTVGCVAGFTLAITGNDDGWPFRAAAKALELSISDAEFLFYGYEGHGLSHIETNSDEATVDEAIKRLNILIDLCDVQICPEDR